jgi:coenzyme Q-binding protein COQ10
MAASISREVLIAVRPDALFDVIVDYDRYPQFVPSVKQCRADRRADATDVEYVVDLGIKTIRYTLRHHEQRPSLVRWELVAGDWMKLSNGSWELSEEGGQTRARYTVEVQIAKPPLVPQVVVDRVTDELTRVQLPRTLAAFKARAESLRPAGTP